MQHYPIAITGMHRSGTSMITRGLHDSGLHLLGPGADQLLDAADDNPEGFWENKAIVACNDDLLEATGGAWDRPPALPPQAADDPRVSRIAEAATAALAGLREHDHWGFKDPRLCLTAPYWLDLEPDLRFIVCVRHPLEVALSLKRRNQNSYSLGLSLWERYYATVLATVPPERRIVTHFDTFFSDPRGELGRLCAFAGLEPADPHVRDDLRHHTVGVTLGEAGASTSLQALYLDLCRAAGTPLVPESPVDEGRVRRLILDGAVSRRHAEQRQDAIDRLQEREVELRRTWTEAEIELRSQVRALEATKAKVETDHRARIRALEAQVASSAAKAEADQRGRVHALELKVATAEARAETLAGSMRGLATSVARTEASVKAVNQVLQGSPFRRVGRRWENLAARGARKYVVRPGRRAVAAKALPDAAAAARRLPPPAKKVLRRGRRAVAQSKRAARLHATSVARRLPPPAQTTLRRGRVALRRIRDRPPVRPTAAPTRAAPATPRGPASKEWKQGYTDLVAATVPGGERWLVVTPGSPGDVRLGRSPKGTAFPNQADAQPLAHDLAYIAQLEALRFRGHRHLVLPEGSRPWFAQRAELRGHVTGRYRTVVDRAQAGAVFDLTGRAEAGTRSLRTEVTEMAAALREAPAVLDWTDLGIAAELPGVTTFRPPPGDVLPYLDASVEIVVVDGQRDPRQAARVASLCVITVAPGVSGTVEVRSVEAKADLVSAVMPRTLVWSTDPHDDEVWRALLAECVADSGAELRLATVDGRGLGDVDDFGVVVMIEPHVLPLPASIEAAVALAMIDPSSAVAGKIIRADGSLEAAGGTVFSDRSTGLIAFASRDVRAPWHEYVRPVCWAPGLVAAAAPLWKATPAPEGVSGRTFVREWCSAVWASGRAVTYQPTVAAVRLSGDGGEASTPLYESAWQRVLDLRPQRPKDLGDGAWRYILAHDDVEGCRG